MTKEQLIKFVKNEFYSGNSVLVCPMGSGGFGSFLVNDIDFADYLESLDFAGVVNPFYYLSKSNYFDCELPTYQFDGFFGFHIQIQISKYYDI